MNSQPISYPRPLPRDLPGFDVAAAVARMMDSAELWWRALMIFHAHFGGWEAAWLQSQTTPEAERKCVHALRSAAANIGAVRLDAAAATLENALTWSAFPPQSLAPLRALLLECFREAHGSATAVLMPESSPVETAP